LKKEMNTKEKIRSRDRKIGEILLDEELISKDQLQEAFRIHKGRDIYKPIGQIFVDQKFITKKQLNFLLDRHLKRPKLGNILVRSGILSEHELDIALEHQQKSDLRLGEILVKLDFITEELMRKTLCAQLNIPYIKLETTSLDRSLVRIINKSYAKKHNIVPIARVGDTVTLAMDDPTSFWLVEELEATSGLNINAVTSTRASIQDAFYRLYENKDLLSGDIGVELIKEDDTDTAIMATYLESHDIVKADALMSKIISMGLQNSASDIHIESGDQNIAVRFRIDGVLREPDFSFFQNDLNKNRRQIISRIKILGKMDIAERRRPQDGSFRAQIVKDGNEFKIDFRVSVIPGYYGENAVLRILDNRKAPKTIDQLAFSEKITEKLHQLLKRNTGLILITGPTGSGKSTTLYGALMTLYRPGIKILTAEDPIEYVYENITQCEVNYKIGNTFANYIRAFLRQDPEVIMVGEIRDAETAEMAFGAAQTGHLVLSTLHTNDAISSITRLLGLGVDRNLITSCLLGVVSQRLVREICSHCKKEYVPSEELLKEFFETPPTDIQWFKGQKCSLCDYTGYNGRIALAQIWMPNENDVILINKGAVIDELRKSSYQSTVFMLEDAVRLLRDGRTNLEELIRALPYSHIYESRQILKSENLG